MTDSLPPGTREQLLALILGHAMRREPFRLGVDWPDGPGVRAAYDEALEVARGVLGWPGFRAEAPYADADRDSDPGAPPPIAPISPAETETGHDTDEARMSAELHVAGHPLIQHKLGLMRETSCASNDFRRLLGEIAMLLCYEVTRDLPLEDAPIETPLEPMMAPRLAGRKLVLAPVLRAGLGMLDGMLSLIPSARVAHVGLFRDPATLQAVEYYFKAPSDVAERLVLVLDPMLATAHSAVAAVDRFKARGCKDLRFVCLLAAPEGIRHFHEHHPDVPVWTASVDRALDDHGYIRPGLGDAGDRMWGTK